MPQINSTNNRYYFVWETRADQTSHNSSTAKIKKKKQMKPTKAVAQNSANITDQPHGEKKICSDVPGFLSLP